MREKLLLLDATGQNGPPEAQIACTFVDWLEALAGCENREELAARVKVDSRTLRRLAAGKGGRRTVARLAAEIGVPLWMVHETMFPAITAVHAVWSAGCAPETWRQALEAAVRIAASLLALSSDGLSDQGRTHLHPADIRVLLKWFESLVDGSKTDLAQRAGVTRQTLWLYAKGDMSRQALRRLIGRVGLPLWVVEGVMLPAIRAVRLVVQLPRRERILAGWELELTAALPIGLANFTDLSVQEIVFEASRRSAAGPSVEDRRLGEGQWRLLKDRSPVERVLLVKNCRELQTWELAEHLCLESEDAASDSARVALQIALLALRVARLVREEVLFSLRLEGHVLLYVGNARRVAGRMNQAEEAFSRGLDLWRRGSGTKYDLLAAWRVLDLEGSLRRSQRRFPEALDRLDGALEIAPREHWGRILLKKASTFNQMGDPAAALSALQEAAPLLEDQKTTRLWLVWNFLCVENLCHLSRFQEARDLLPTAQALAVELGEKRLDRTRLEWVAGRIAAGLGEHEEALVYFETLQSEYKRLDIAFDYALVSVEAGAVMLELGRNQEVKDLTLKMKWIFTKEGVHPEAVKALNLFRQAVEREKATPELAREVVRFLYRAQHNPELKFAA